MKKIVIKIENPTDRELLIPFISKDFMMQQTQTNDSSIFIKNAIITSGIPRVNIFTILYDLFTYEYKMKYVRVGFAHRTVGMSKMSDIIKVRWNSGPDDYAGTKIRMEPHVPNLENTFMFAECNHHLNSTTTLSMLVSPKTTLQVIMDIEDFQLTHEQPQENREKQSYSLYRLTGMDGVLAMYKNIITDADADTVMEFVFSEVKSGNRGYLMTEDEEGNVTSIAVGNQPPVIGGTPKTNLGEAYWEAVRKKEEIEKTMYK